MAITITQDKEIIKSILDTDDYIVNKAKFSPSDIKTTKATSKIYENTEPSFQIYISNGTSENLNSDIAKGIVYNINILGKRTNSNRIELVAEQVIALLQNKSIGRGHILYLLDPPMEKETPEAIYELELSFLCQSTVFNKKK